MGFVVSEEMVAFARAEHYPEKPSCGCSSGYKCSSCGTRWPCDAERTLRSLGAAPITISDYPQHAEEL